MDLTDNLFNKFLVENVAREICISYNGGQRPGQTRRIQLIHLDDEKIGAKEPPLHFIKHFFINKIIWAETLDGCVKVENPLCGPLGDVPPQMETFAEYAEFFMPELTTRGWCVHCNIDRMTLSVNTPLKNGQPRKTMAVSVHYEHPPTADDLLRERKHLFEMFGDDANEMYSQPSHSKRKRPWHVTNLTSDGRAFGLMHGAMKAFIELVRKHDPSTVRYS
jgi:hypothetical protein